MFFQRTEHSRHSLSLSFSLSFFLGCKWKYVYANAASRYVLRGEILSRSRDELLCLDNLSRETERDVIKDCDF